MMTKTKMSIFNRYVNPTTKDVTFIKHLIDNVFWDDRKEVNQDKGHSKANNVQVFIPKNKNDLSDLVKPSQFDGEKNWTIATGDFIVKGDIDKSSVSKISELEDAFTITFVDEKDYGSPNMHHFEIKGE